MERERTGKGGEGTEKGDLGKKLGAEGGNGSVKGEGIEEVEGGYKGGAGK